LRRCVFTVLTGGYEALNEQPVAADSALQFICFTDRPVASATWQIRDMVKPFAADDFRNQRSYKLRPHAVLPEFDASLYIDNSVILKRPPESLFETTDLTRGLALPAHSFRATLRDEFAEVIAQRLDDPARLTTQLADYEAAYPDILDRPPVWCGLMLRDHRHPLAIGAADIWAAHVYRYSRRDQLSSLVACHLAGLVPEILKLDNHESPFHSWPHIADRRTEMRSWAGETQLVDALRLETVQLQAQLRQLQAERAALLESRSWRITSRLRRTARRLTAWRRGNRTA